MLVHEEAYTHSYPHCWRSKTPIIFRAMNQWFIRIDHVPSPSVAASTETGESRTGLGLPAAEGKVSSASLDQITAKYLEDQLAAGQAAGDALNASFRNQALAAIDRVQWIPEWGKNRIEAAVKSRPDWCISRQRTWGVPIPAFYDGQGNPILDARVIRTTADLVERHGSNIWFEKSMAELWALTKPADWQGADPAAKSTDTLDVWIDSGSSSRTVIGSRLELARDSQGTRLNCQADMYLEGSDQHRGWFQSSLLLSLAGNGYEPFRSVMTHGFMVDADREKISKSKQGQGGYEKPQTADAYVKKYGADVVRLWVASQDFRSDIIVSDERINKVGETYRVIRNALRYQLSNLYDFDPLKHQVLPHDRTALDRWILDAFVHLRHEVLEAYDQHEFHVVYQKISQFVAVELSAIYHDVVKDRLYTDGANSPRRRSTQTVLHILVTGLCQLLSPILAFTADEAWEFIPGRPAGESVHTEVLETIGFVRDAGERAAWEKLMELRNLALPKLEAARQAKLIGKSLEACVTMVVIPERLPNGPQEEESLRELLNVSQLKVQEQPVESGEMTITVSRAGGQKCERCWRWETDVNTHAQHPGICGRCVEAIA
jgi:isoleucyl-tRNA synthetase